MNLPRLFRTTAVRLTLRYALAYAVVMSLLLTALYWISSRYVDSQLEAGLEQELFSLSGKFDSGGPQQLAQAVSRREENGLEDGRYYLLVGRDGARIAGNLSAWPPDSNIAYDGKVHSVWVEDDVIPGKRYQDDAYWPVIARELPDGSRLMLSRSVRQAEDLQESTLYLMMFILVIAVLLALAMGVTLGRTILGRMDTISRAAGEIMAGDLSRRVPASGGNDEFDTLADRLNSMLDRIQQLIKGIREVTDNVAHDLRSPLSRLRNRLEITLLEGRSNDEYRHTIGKTIEDAESLIKTFNTMLGIAQLDSGNNRAQLGHVDLNTLASDLEELYKPVAGLKGQDFRLVTGEPAEIIGSRDLLAQAIGNLLDNAIKYTPEGGAILLQVKRLEDTTEVLVRDSGAGIPVAERAHVLERFVRLESSRHTQGNGLGLSLVKAVARLHGAELRLGDAGPGLIVTLRFPHNRAD
ncbi:MAG: ATP-binding protein [Gammaproteobacteria bacterium]